MMMKYVRGETEMGDNHRSFLLHPRVAAADREDCFGRCQEMTLAVFQQELYLQLEGEEVD